METLHPFDRKPVTRGQALDLLSSLVTADVIQDQADGSTTDGVNFNFSSSGSFVNLAVTGHPEINDNVPPNTKVSLAGLGTLWLHRITKGKNSIMVTMIELKVDQINVFNLPIGADIKISVAEASVHSLTHP